MSLKPDPCNPYVWERHSFVGKRLPRSRGVRSFLLMVPWITLMAIGVLFYGLTRQTLVQSGRVVELPSGPVEEGLLARCPTAVVRRLVAPDRKNVTVLLLDEGRYSSDNPMELEALLLAHPGIELNLIVDAAVSYGETLAWVERLRNCGTERINLVTRPATPSDSESPHL